MEGIYSYALVRKWLKIYSDKCPEAWKGFTSAFEFKDPNNITGDDYEAYFDALPIFSPPNSVVFWSGARCN